jgi:hypothetical protein
MVRKSALRWTRLVVGAISWSTAAWIAQGAVGTDIGGAGHELEERIELRLRGGGIPVLPPPEPPRTHEDSIEPWELVSV